MNFLIFSDEANINATLSSVGIKPNPSAVKILLAATSGKTPEQVKFFIEIILLMKIINVFKATLLFSLTI